MDNVSQVELFLDAFANPAMHALEHHLDVARAELDTVVEIVELALVSDLDRATMAALGFSDADTLWNAGEMIEALDVIGYEVGVEYLKQCQVFAQRTRSLGRFELEKEGYEHARHFARAKPHRQTHRQRRVQVARGETAFQRGCNTQNLTKVKIGFSLSW